MVIHMFFAYCARFFFLEMNKTLIMCCFEKLPWLTFMKAHFDFIACFSKTTLRFLWKYDMQSK